ncbi:hypothetical protein MHBO_004391, partial [Bonamia ostreae]
MTRIIGSGNPNYGVVQTNSYLDRTESLPVDQIVLTAMGTVLNIPSNRAETHTLRVNEQIAIDGEMLAPLNPNILNGERIISPKASVTSMKPQVYGVTIVVSEHTRVNTPENIYASISTLLSGYEMRLKEAIIYNALLTANLVDYTFSQGGTASPMKANVRDLIEMTSIMERNKVGACLSFIPADANTYTRSVPTRYAMVASIAGATAIKKNLSPEEFTQTHRFANTKSYEFPSKGTVERAN